MKLYTQQQLENAIMSAYIATKLVLELKKLECKISKPIDIEVVFSVVMNETTPIELPSDEEIQDESEKYYDNNAAKAHDYYFELGAKWMRDKIQGGNK